MPEQRATYYWSVTDINGVVLCSGYTEDRAGVAAQLAAFVLHAPREELLTPTFQHRLVVRELVMMHE